VAYFLDDPRPFTRSPKIDNGRPRRNRPLQEVSGRRAICDTLAFGGHRALEAWPTAPPPYLRRSDPGSDGGRPRGHVNAAAHNPRELPRNTNTLLILEPTRLAPPPNLPPNSGTPAGHN
jgi:hypothetical protein